MREYVRQKNVEDFLSEYVEFLVSHGLRPNAAKVYASKLRRFLKSGYTVADLCGGVEWLIDRNGKGGADYDPKDHGNTYNALKWLLRFLLGDLDPNFFIDYRSGWTSFPRADKQMVGYRIFGKTIEVEYHAGFSAAGVEKKTISDVGFYRLIKMMRRHAGKLADSHTALKTHHGAAHSYQYRFEGREGIECGCLFSDDAAMAEYRGWLAPFVD